MNGRKLSWYRDKGYNVNKDSIIFVNTLDFPPNSKVRVKAKCECCGEIREVVRAEYTKECIKCTASKNSPFKNLIGEKNIHFNHTYTAEERDLVLRQARGGQFKIWSLEIKKRDNFTCIICKDNKGGNLNSHHLNSFAKYPLGRTDLLNGVCLCEKCHKDFHKQYGNKNNTKEQFEEYYINKIEEIEYGL